MLTRRDLLAASAVAACPRWTSAAAKPKFQLGLVTYNVAKDWDLLTILAHCRAAGIAAVECRTSHKHGVEPSLDIDARKRIKQQFIDSSIRFWGCGSTCEYHSDQPAVVAKNIEETKRFIELVAAMGGRGVKVRPNGVAKGMSVAQACEQIGKALIPCGKAAADAGIEIWVEVHGATTALPKNMKAILDACEHPAVGVTWNSNATDLENGSIAAGFELLAKHIKSCHINELANDAAGKYPYRDLFTRLTNIGYDRYTFIEIGQSIEPAKGVDYLKQYKATWTKLCGSA
jgi:sugar phosphate isomerase/epimerase